MMQPRPPIMQPLHYFVTALTEMTAMVLRHSGTFCELHPIPVPVRSASWRCAVFVGEPRRCGTANVLRKLHSKNAVAVCRPVKPLSFYCPEIHFRRVLPQTASWKSVVYGRIIAIQCSPGVFASGNHVSLPQTTHRRRSRKLLCHNFCNVSSILVHCNDALE
jgi:hypothetical protein